MSVSISALHVTEDAIEVCFTMTDWGAPKKRGTVVPGETTLSTIDAFRGALEVQEVVLCPDGTVGLRVGNEHGRIHIVGIRDEEG